MIGIRLFCSVLLVLLAVLALPLAVYGAAMSAFEPTSNYNTHLPESVALAIIAFALLPAIAIWIPRKAALIFGGLILLPPAVIALFLIWAAPVGGLVASLPIGFWYFGAVSIWKRLWPATADGREVSPCRRGAGGRGA